jgi:type IX secretion system PorP/SprF family membrane protein
MNWKTYICGLISIFAAKNQLLAQQPAQYSLSMLNMYNYNTAYAGLDGSVSTTAVFRKQWTNLDGSPLTYQVNAHLPLPYLRSGFGLGLERDQLGAIVNTSARLSYNYMVSLSKKTVLSFGAAGKFVQMSLDGSLLRTPEGNYEGSTFNHNDQILSSTKAQGSTISAEAGLFIKGEKFQIGASAINLNAPLVKLATSQILQFQYTRAYFLQGQYKWNITQDWELQTDFLLKTDFVKWQPEFTAMARWKQQFFAGVGYRGYNNMTQDAVVLLAGMQINKNFVLAYGYDVSLNALRGLNSGSHEVVLNYNLRKDLGKQIPQKIIYNPRFL